MPAAGTKYVSQAKQDVLDNVPLGVFLDTGRGLEFEGQGAYALADIDINDQFKGDVR